MDYDYIKCGDCLELMKEIPDRSLDMILCDMPFGETRCKWDLRIPLEPLWVQYKRIIKEHGVIALFADEPFSSVLVTSNLKMYRYELIWQKEHGTDFLNANRKPLGIHEKIQIFYYHQPTYNKQTTQGKPYKRQESHKFSDCYGDFVPHLLDCPDGKRNPTTIIKISRGGGDRGFHPTQKPVALCEWLIKTYTNEGDIVLDNAMGSGTTCVAAKRTNRHYIGFELDEKYFEIAKQRIEKG